MDKDIIHSLKPAAIPKADFDSFIDELITLVCEYGLNKIRPTRGDRLSFISFMVQVHEGWKLAQHRCIEMLIRISNSKNSIVEFRMRHSGDKKIRQACRFAEKELDFQERMVRSFIDSIIWQIFKLDHWRLRRFFLAEDIGNFSIETLNSNLSFVNEFNEKPNQLAILTDLSSFFHLGDVILIDLS
ncbi:MAG TPA: hypothetical protein VGA99_02285 [bacterium]